jgi:ribonuclease HI
MSTYYVVHKGRVPGIYTSWNDCKKQVDKFEGAIFKKFSNKPDAELFLKDGFGENKKPRCVVRKENDDKKNNTKIMDETIEDDSDKIFIYTDGSCIKFKNNISKAGFGIYIPDKDIKIGEPLLNQKITNNRAEMTAIINSLKYLDEWELLKKICIFTDSQYSMYIFNGTGERYESNGYKNDGKDVPNIDLIKKLLDLKRKYNIVLLKVRAHTDKKDRHSLGNEVADKLAQKGALSNDDSNNIFSALVSSENNNFEEEKINKDVQMNELFEFDEGEEFDLNNIKKKGKPSKNPKLSNWFIKSKL